MENKISRKKNPPTKKEIELANKLRAKRLENNLSLQEVADKLGVSKVTVSRYETLDITNIPSDKIEGMAELYNTTPAYLMGWEDKKEENTFNLKQRRLELKMTLKDVADVVGVEESTIRKWELGIISNMKRDKIELLAKALKVSPLDIMGIQKDTPTEIVSNFRLDTKELDKMNLSDKDLNEINSEMQRYFNYIISEFKKNEGDK